MNLKLENRLALVSGSTTGIGFAVAKAIAAEGARVIVNGRSRASVDEALSKLKGSRGEVFGFAGDLSTESAADQVAKAFPDVDILVNNLGIFEPTAYRFSLSDFQVAAQFSLVSCPCFHPFQQAVQRWTERLSPLR